MIALGAVPETMLHPCTYISTPAPAPSKRALPLAVSTSSFSIPQRTPSSAGFTPLLPGSHLTPWISPGVFGGGVQDVTSLSHETSAALNDPFGNNIVPTRQFPVFPDFARQTWRLATLWNCFPPALYPSRSRNGAKYSSITPRPRRCSSGVKSATLPTPSEAHTVIPTQPLFP